MSAVAQYFNGPSSARRRTRNKVFSSDAPADLSGVGFGDDATKIVKALNRHVERGFNPDRKEHHWGKRKLLRDR